MHGGPVHMWRFLSQLEFLSISPVEGPFTRRGSIHTWRSHSHMEVLFYTRRFFLLTEVQFSVDEGADPILMWKSHFHVEDLSHVEILFTCGGPVHSWKSCSQVEVPFTSHVEDPFAGRGPVHMSWSHSQVHCGGPVLTWKTCSHLDILFTCGVLFTHGAPIPDWSRSHSQVEVLVHGWIEFPLTYEKKHIYTGVGLVHMWRSHSSVDPFTHGSRTCSEVHVLFTCEWSVHTPFCTWWTHSHTLGPVHRCDVPFTRWYPFTYAHHTHSHAVHTCIHTRSHPFGTPRL